MLSLEEDESFYGADPPKQAEAATASLENGDAQASPLLQPSARSPSVREREQEPSPKPAKRPRLQLEEEDEELPSLSQLAQTTRIDVTNVDLGRRPANQSIHTPISATNFDGRKITFKWRTQPTRSVDRANVPIKARLGLLEKPIYQLMAEIEDDAKLAATIGKQAEIQPLTESNLKRKSRKPQILWTDKYKPQKFVDLLGDDRTNRTAMTWLKAWDRCAFREAQQQPNARKKAARNPFEREKDPEIPVDPFGRPHEKILLLSGPPGLGKTTLAHVLAKQAGYQVHEINASDDRTAKVVTERIRDAIESRAIGVDGAMSSNKPTCVVIDEIDGATGGGDTSFIRTLVKFIMDGSKLSKGKHTKQQQHKPLMRPIICICNDLYAPVLRPLRPLAKLIRISQPTPASIVQRIRTICDSECMISDNKSLAALCSVAEGDMRTCLNTLQFIKTKSDKLTETIVKSAALGLKDTGTSASAVWDHLFKVPYDRKGKSVGSNGRYIERLVRDISTCGEYDRILLGCFEHYPKAKFPVDGWSSVDRAMDWVMFHDRIDASLRADRNFELLAYQPFGLVAWYPLFASLTSPAVEWPKADYEAFLKKSAHQEVAEAFSKTMPVLLKTCFNMQTTVTDLIPLLTRVISPDIKLIGTQLTKTEDRLIVNRLCALLKHFRLSYVQDYNEEGQLIYKLDPPLEVFVHYDGKRAPDLPPSRYNVRQLVSQQMEALPGDQTAAPSTASDLLSAYKNNPSTLDPNSRQERVALDFFGRKKVIKADPEQSNTATEPNYPEILRKPAKVTFRYNEGTSSAVRLPIKIANLFDVNIKPQ